MAKAVSIKICSKKIHLSSSDYLMHLIIVRWQKIIITYSLTKVLELRLAKIENKYLLNLTFITVQRTMCEMHQKSYCYKNALCLIKM